MPLIVPIDSTDPEWRQTTSLDETTYVLRGSWSDRAECWYLSVYFQTAGDELVPIVQGAKLSVGYPTLLGVVGDNRPRGELIPVDVSDRIGLGVDPGRYDLGTRVLLFYSTAEELGRAVP